MVLTENNRTFNHFYVARQPIFNNAGETWGFELLYRSGSEKQAAEMENQDIASLCVATCGFTQSQEFCDQTKKICINFTEKLILEGAPRGLPPSVAVIKLLENVTATEEMVKMLVELKQEGYNIAIDAHAAIDNQKDFLDIADIIIINVLEKTTQEIEDILRGINSNEALKLAVKVDNRETLQHLRSLGCDLYQGYFFAKPVNLRGRILKSPKISKLRILQAVEDPAFDVETAKEIIATDPSITYGLLRLLNSAAFSFAVKIESVIHAIRLIGLKHLKYWLRMVIMSDLSDNHQTPELYMMALNRGRFLEELAQHEQIRSANQETMFLFGMLSLIEPMLEIPMSNIMDELPLADEIKSGYIDSDSIYAKYLQLTIAVENADSAEIERLCEEIGVNEKEVADASNRSIAWTNTIYQSMT